MSTLLDIALQQFANAGTILIYGIMLFYACVGIIMLAKIIKG